MIYCNFLYRIKPAPLTDEQECRLVVGTLMRRIQRDPTIEESLVSAIQSGQQPQAWLQQYKALLELDPIVSHLLHLFERARC